MYVYANVYLVLNHKQYQISNQHRPISTISNRLSEHWLKSIIGATLDGSGKLQVVIKTIALDVNALLMPL